MDKEKLVLLALLLYYISDGKPCELIEEALRDLKGSNSLSENELSMIAERLVKEMLTRKITLRGIVVSGSGEGKYFLSLEGYRSQIRSRLGFDPYPGTLNVLLDPESVERKFLVLTRQPIILRGFKEGDRTYGDVLAYPARIGDVWPTALVIPLRTHHPPSIIELISPFNLRERLSLKDGDVVEVEVY